MLAWCGACVAATRDWVRSTTRTYDDVMERVQFAIENRGLVISYTARVGDMLQRTAKDLGTSSRIYDRAEVLEFCSARYSADAMAADPHSIVQCPYAIAVYKLAAQPKTVYVSYRKNSGEAGSPLGVIDRLLSDIIVEALQ